MKKQRIVVFLIISICLMNLAGCGDKPNNPTVVPSGVATYTPEATAEPSAEPTAEPTIEATATPTMEATATPTIETTAIPTVDVTAAPTLEPSVEPTVEVTAKPTITVEPTITSNPTGAATPLPTEETVELSSTPILTDTPTAEPTKEPVVKATPTNTSTPTPSEKPSATASPTATPKPTATNTPSPKPTATNTPTPNPTNTNTPTPNPTNTNTPTPNPTATNTPIPSSTATNTPSPKPTNTNTPTPSPANTNTPTPSPTNTNTPTPSPTNTNTPTPKPTATNSPSPSQAAALSDAQSAIVNNLISKPNTQMWGLDVSSSESVESDLKKEVLDTFAYSYYLPSSRLITMLYDSAELIYTAEQIKALYPEIGSIEIDYDSSAKYYNGYYICYSITLNGMADIAYYYRTGDDSGLDDNDKYSVNRVNEISTELGLAGKSQEEIVHLVHDYLVKNTVYDSYCASTGENYVSHTAYGLLKNGLAVCDGYSQTFMMFMIKQGIDCIIVTGPNHAWNQVKVNNVWYNIDVTWDDPIGGDPDFITYNYYLISTADMVAKDSRGSHVIDSDVEMECTVTYDSTQVNLAQYMKFNATNETEILNMFLAQKDNEKVYVTVAKSMGLSQYDMGRYYMEAYNLHRYSYYPVKDLGDYYVYWFVGPTQLASAGTRSNLNTLAA